MTTDCPRQFCTASYGRQSEMLDQTYATWIAQSDTSTPPISTRGNGGRWRTIAVHGVWPSKGAAKAETKRETNAEIKRQRRQERALALAHRTNQQPEFACRYCGRKLAARIGQLSLERACVRKVDRFCDVNVILETEKTADAVFFGTSRTLNSISKIIWSQWLRS